MTLKERQAQIRTLMRDLHCDAKGCVWTNPCLGCQARIMNEHEPGSGIEALRDAFGEKEKRIMNEPGLGSCEIEAP